MGILRIVNHSTHVLHELGKASIVRPASDRRHKVILSVNHIEHFRPFRWLLIIFQLAGYDVYLVGRANKRTIRLASDAKWHPNLKIMWQQPEPSRQYIYCTDMGDVSHADKYLKVIRLKYDYGPAMVLPDESHFAMPYFMHPQIYGQYHEHEHLDDYRECPRPLRLLIAGNYDPSYDNKWIRDVCQKLPRYTVVQHLKSKKLVTIINNEDDLRRIQQATNPMILIDQPLRINQQYWLSLLSSSQFFLSLPGVQIPLAHNLIESLAVGTVPVMNYPDWLRPPLSNGQNSLTFATLEELEQHLEWIKQADEGTLARMRTGAIRYYDDHLDPAKFIQRLMQSPSQKVTLHVLDESENAVLRAMRKAI